MRDLSRNTRRKLINLAFRVLAKETPECEIRQDPLYRLYPDINYGLEVEFPELESAERGKQMVVEAFLRRGYKIYSSDVGLRGQHGHARLILSGFYTEDVEDPK